MDEEDRGRRDGRTGRRSGTIQRTGEDRLPSVGTARRRFERREGRSGSIKGSWRSRVV